MSALKQSSRLADTSYRAYDEAPYSRERPNQEAQSTLKKRQPQTVATNSVVNALLAHATQATAKVGTIHHCWPSIGVN